MLNKLRKQEKIIGRWKRIKNWKGIMGKFKYLL